MARHNWDEIIENLRNHPGDWILVAELAQGDTQFKRLQAAGMETRREPVTGRLYNVYARYPEADHDSPT